MQYNATGQNVITHSNNTMQYNATGQNVITQSNNTMQYNATGQNVITQQQYNAIQYYRLQHTKYSTI